MEMPDSIDIIRKYLTEEFELEEDDIVEMLEEYFSNMDSLVSVAREQLGNSSFAELKKTVHSIKGASANIGINGSAAICKQIEEESLSGNKEKCAELMDELKKNTEQLKSSWQAQR